MQGNAAGAGKPHTLPPSVRLQLIGPSRGRLLILGDLLLLGGLRDSRRVEVHQNGEVDESGQHFFLGLIAPVDGFRGVGIEGIVRRVVVPRGGDNFGSLGKHDGLV